MDLEDRQDPHHHSEAALADLLIAQVRLDLMVHHQETHSVEVALTVHHTDLEDFLVLMDLHPDLVSVQTDLHLDLDLDQMAPLPDLVLDLTDCSDLMVHHPDHPHLVQEALHPARHLMALKVVMTDLLTDQDLMVLMGLHQDHHLVQEVPHLVHHSKLLTDPVVQMGHPTDHNHSDLMVPPPELHLDQMALHLDPDSVPTVHHHLVLMVHPPDLHSGPMVHHPDPHSVQMVHPPDLHSVPMVHPPDHHLVPTAPLLAHHSVQMVPHPALLSVAVKTGQEHSLSQTLHLASD